MKGLEAKTLGLRKVIRHEYKRIVAFMLTVAMVVTNFGTNLTVAFAAGEEESSLFLLNSSELEDAISAALVSGDVFDFSSLELKAKQKSLKTSYEKLIGSKAGKVYQLRVDIDSSYADRAYRSAGILQRRHRRCGIPVHQRERHGSHLPRKRKWI